MRLKTIELYLGVPILIILGTLFHFMFQWTGFFLPTAWLFAVNESAWEHTKLVFFPMILYAIFTYPLIKDEANNIILAKIVHYYTGIVFIVGVYYGYSAILGDHYLPIDISLFIFGTIFGLIFSYHIERRAAFSKQIQVLSVILALITIFLVIWWTYDPPENDIFKELTSRLSGPVIP
ncbi:MAG: hypothetical protein INQ03_17115 [Candidatus Heimdallarchaeota archaeon]|nr:hypothetical protein [Candidatus Heimdallarchaeota archaeon]